MSKNRGLLIGMFAFLLIFSTGLIDAIECSPTNQTILSLYSATNSHVALFNESFQDIDAIKDICYNEIFGNEWTGINPWNCNGNNKILGISDKLNAHAEDPGLANYGVNVCYGNLKCSLRNSCNTDEIEVLVLSDTTNAHTGVNSTYAPSYTNKVCCKNKVSVSNTIELVEWRDMTNTEIVTSNVNSTVKVYIKSSSNSDSQSIDITIKRKNTFMGIDIFATDRIIDFEPLNFINGVVSFDWEINDSSMDEDDRTFYFVAETATDSETSENLNVLNSMSCGDTLNIDISFNDRCPIVIGRTININYTLPNPSDGIGLRNNWTIYNSDDSIAYQSNQLTFDYTPSTGGIKRIHLDSENGCGIKVSREKSLMVLVNGDNIYAYISSPKYSQVFGFPTGEPMGIDYDGTGSYVMNVDVDLGGNIVSANCLAGDCPTNSECGINTPNPSLGYSNLYFNWTRFSRNGAMQLLEGNEKVAGKSFYTNSRNNKVNEEQYYLDLKYPDKMGSLFSNNKVNFTAGRCIEDGQKWIVVNSQGMYIGKQSTIQGTLFFNRNACKGIDGNASTPQDNCCPNGMRCGSNGCEVISTPPCAGECCAYTEEECNARNSPPGVPNPCIDATGVYSKCEWNSTLSRCDPKQITISSLDGSVLNTVTRRSENLTGCDLDIGFWRVNVTTLCTNETYACGAACGTSSIVQLPCGKPALQLNFFEKGQLIQTIILIILVYVIIYFTSRHHIFKLR